MTPTDAAVAPRIALSADQRRIVVIAWLTYASLYLGRLNLSPALPAIADALELGLGEVGALGTVFFWSYAAGQVVNGQLGNYFRPQRVILTGILVIALANIVFSLQSSLPVMAAVWGLNGFGQAAGWGPMLRILSTHLSAPQSRRLSTLFSMSFQVGTAVSWGIAGLLIAFGGWRMAFWVPGLLLILVAVMWRWQGLGPAANTPAAAAFRLRDVYAELHHLTPFLLATACVGFIYLGFFLWLPTLFGLWSFLPQWSVRMVTALVPLIGIPGMQLSGVLLSRQADLLRTVTTVLSGLLAALLLSYLTEGVAQFVFVLLAVMLASGMAGLLLSSVPLLLAVDGRVSSAGGLLTAVWSVAGGLSGAVIGGVAESAGWPFVFVLWVGLAAVALVAVRVAARQRLFSSEGVQG